jgi:hypothetical protein
MNQNQMTREKIEFDSAMPDNPFSANNTIWDQSAKILNAVLDNTSMLPDDHENKTDHDAPASGIINRVTPGLNKKTKTPMTKFALACLQEEHALWLK